MIKIITNDVILTSNANKPPNYLFYVNQYLTDFLAANLIYVAVD